MCASKPKSTKFFLERRSQVKRKRQKVVAQMMQAGESLRKQTKRHKNVKEALKLEKATKS